MRRATCLHLARRSFAALLPGGRIYLHEMLLADTKDSPLAATSFSLLMAMETCGQQFTLYGTGEESGTYQFFTQVTVGEEGVSRDDYTVTEGHPATADAVAEDPSGLGFLPLPRYLENQDRLRLVAVDGGDGCVEPSAETIQDGTYAPLSRPMYLYVRHESLAHPALQDFLTFWFEDAAALTEAGGLVPTQETVYAAIIEKLAALIEEVREATPVAEWRPEHRTAV